MHPIWPPQFLYHHSGPFIHNFGILKTNLLQAIEDLDVGYLEDTLQQDMRKITFEIV